MERKRCRDIMTRRVITIQADESIYRAARLMKENDIGVLPVMRNGKLSGILTDRDIVVRAIAEGVSAKVSVDQIMTRQVFSVYEDEFVFDATRKMGENQVRRVPVLDRDNNLVGIISMADIALENEDRIEIAEVLEDISSGKSFWKKF